MRLFIIFLLGFLLTASSTNIILNPNYAQGFDYWENDSWQIKNGSAGITLKGTTRELCTIPYTILNSDIHFGVEVKAIKPSTAYKSGKGYGSIIFRWYDENGVRLFDESYNLTDNLPKGFNKKTLTVTPSGSSVRFCMKAVAFQNKIFTLRVRGWRAWQ